MKPMIIIPPDLISADHIKKLDENDICVVVATDPAKVKFVDPIPAQSSRTQIEDAAIRLSRILLNRQWGQYSQSGTIGQSEFARIYIDILMEGTALDAKGTWEEQAKTIYDSAKAEEVRKMAREDARAEREAKKKAKS